MKNLDLSGQNVLTMRDAQSAASSGATQVRVAQRCVVTPSAQDFLRQNGIELVMGAVIGSPGASSSVTVSAPAAISTTAAGNGGATARIINVAGGGAAPKSVASATRKPADPRLFTTPEAEAVKLEICAVGKKLWNRQYVDGNGGNISYRIGPNEVICTPTLVSKYDLTPDDLCLVDLDGKQVAGKRPRTSNSAASGDIQGGARGKVVRALSSSACYGVCDHRPSPAKPCYSGV